MVGRGERKFRILLSTLSRAAMSSGDIYYPSRRKSVVVAAALVTVIMFTAAGLPYHEYGFRHLNDLISRTMKEIVTSPHRKLLLSWIWTLDFGGVLLKSLGFKSATEDDVDNPTRIMGDIKVCSDSDLVVNQGPSHPLPSGIPTYTVQITNTCTTGCDIARIHIRCGWFSSARLIDPSLFKRVRYDDCLVNGGNPIPNGQTISFQYANTYSYPLAVTSMKCVQELP
ncbi:hypothetical protein V2J09_006899 [Rumex salicifolius]